MGSAEIIIYNVPGGFAQPLRHPPLGYPWKSVAIQNIHYSCKIGISAKPKNKPKKTPGLLPAVLVPALLQRETIDQNTIFLDCCANYRI